jgi:putative membrane protein
LPVNLVYLLIALLLGGMLSYFLTLKIGKVFARHFVNAPYGLVVKLTITMIVVLVFLFTGVVGVFVLVVATFIGLLPIEWGVRRSHCMGVLLVPIILYFL